MSLADSPRWRYALALGTVVAVLGKGGRRIPGALVLADGLASAPRR